MHAVHRTAGDDTDKTHKRAQYLEQNLNGRLQEGDVSPWGGRLFLQLKHALLSRFTQFRGKLHGLHKGTMSEVQRDTINARWMQK